MIPRLKTSDNGLKKIDALGWTSGFAFESYGVRIGIRTNERSALEVIQNHLPSDWLRSATPEVDRLYSIKIGRAGARVSTLRQHSLYSDERRLARSVDLDEVMGALESNLRLFVAEYATRHVFVHAGVVGWKGRAIVIPGRSFSGKSTLVAELVKAGARYYSDEYAVFDSRGRVHPFFKPLELRQDGEFEQAKVSVKELGGQAGSKPLPVSLVLMTRYKSGAQWRPRRLTPGKGMLELLFNTVSARRNPARALATFERVTKDAAVLKGVRGNAREVVTAMLARAEREMGTAR